MGGVTKAPQGRWEAAQPGERAFWEQEDWLDELSGDQRRSEWGRHLADLALAEGDFAGQTVLDVGCGPTGIGYFLDAEVVGLDPLALTYQQWNGHFGPPIRLIEGRGEAIPFGPATFDAVFCVNALDHAEDAQLVLREIGRVLKPGGSLVAMVDLDSPLRKLHKRVRPHVGQMHPLSLTYSWLRDQLRAYEILAEARDLRTFTFTRRNLRYEAYWDGLLYRVTGHPRWMHHVWLHARPHPMPAPEPAVSTHSPSR